MYCRCTSVLCIFRIVYVLIQKPLFPLLNSALKVPLKKKKAADLT